MVGPTTKKTRWKCVQGRQAVDDVQFSQSCKPVLIFWVYQNSTESYNGLCLTVLQMKMTSDRHDLSSPVIIVIFWLEFLWTNDLNIFHYLSVPFPGENALSFAVSCFSISLPQRFSLLIHYRFGSGHVGCWFFLLTLSLRCYLRSAWA